MEDITDTDMEVQDNIPSDYWLKSTKLIFLLGCMVHLRSKEVAVVCSDLPSGDTRDTQRANARVRLASEREQERISNAASTMATRDKDLEYQLQKRMRFSIAQVSIIKSQSDIVSLQLKLYTENKDSFVNRHSEEEYDNKINDLLKKLPDPVQDLLAQVATAPVPAPPGPAARRSTVAAAGVAADLDWAEYDRVRGRNHVNNQLQGE